MSTTTDDQLQRLREQIADRELAQVRLADELRDLRAAVHDTECSRRGATSPRLAARFTLVR